MNAMSLHSVFSSLLTRYRQQVTDLDAADDQDDIDRLVNASQDTLTELAGTRPRSAAAMADKVQELIRRYADFGALPMDLVRELLADAYHLASEPGLTLAWVHLWSDIGGWIINQGPGHRYLGLPEPLQVTDTYTASLPVAYKLTNEDEANGAAKTLRALLHMAGLSAADHVFAFAGEGRS